MGVVFARVMILLTLAISAALPMYATAQSAVGSCDPLTRTLSYGSKGDDVARLQRYLARDTSVYPEGTISGFFGTLTEVAVKRWQAKYNVVSDGSPSTTGFGVAGLKTRATMLLHGWCTSGTISLPTLPILIRQAPPPAAPSNTYGSIVPGMNSNYTLSSITIIAPSTSTTAYFGGGFSISWNSSNVRSGASVSLTLVNALTGKDTGEITNGLAASSTYFWQVPNAEGTSNSCTTDAYSCLLALADENCDGPLCHPAAGDYWIRASLVANGAVLTSTTSAIITLTTGSADQSIGNLSFTGETSSSAASGSGAARSQDASISQTLLNTLLQGSDDTTAAKMCTYSGIPYADGISLTVGCGDLQGQSCGGFSGSVVTCKSGVWVDKNGAASTIPTVNSAGSSSGSCKTPWQDQVVQNGRQIPFAPFFTTGIYMVSGVSPMMQCSGGSWLKCDATGSSCTPYIVIENSASQSGAQSQAGTQSRADALAQAAAQAQAASQSSAQSQAGTQAQAGTRAYAQAQIAAQAQAAAQAAAEAQAAAQAAAQAQAAADAARASAQAATQSTIQNVIQNVQTQIYIPSF